MTISSISGSSTGTWKSLVNAVITQINSAFAKRPYVWADSSARLSQTGMTIGEYGRQTDTGVVYRATSSTATQPWESPWITFTPTLANLTIGTGGSALSSARYRYLDGIVEAEYKFVLGSSGFAVGTTPTATLPVTAETLTHTLQVVDGIGSMFDTSGSDLRVAFMQLTSTTVVRFAYVTPAGVGFAIPTATTPWTWAAGDAFHQIIRYIPA